MPSVDKKDSGENGASPRSSPKKKQARQSPAPVSAEAGGAFLAGPLSPLAALNFGLSLHPRPIAFTDPV